MTYRPPAHATTPGRQSPTVSWVGGLGISLLVIGLWTELGPFLFSRGVLPFPPLYLVLAGLAVSAIYWISWGKGARSVLRHPLFVWLVSYVTFCVLATMFSQSPDAYQSLAGRLVPVAAMGSALLLTRQYEVRRRALALITLCGLLAVPLAVVDLLYPLTFSAVVGRGAGLYVNPNSLALALTVAIAAAVVVVSKQRELVVALLLGGLVLTLSRGGMLAVAAGLVGLVATGQLRFVRLAATSVGIAGVAVATGFVSGLFAKLSETALATERLRGILAPGTVGAVDVSALQRREVAEAALDLFARFPVGGAGIGFTSSWPLLAGTHNIYLMHMAEHGISGVWIMPSLLVCLWMSAPRSIRGYLVGSLTVWGLFSHNLLDAWPIVVALPVLLVHSQPKGHHVA